MLQSLVSPALPVIQRDLHTTQGTVTWTLTAWLLSASVATPLLGRIGDIGRQETHSADSPWAPSRSVRWSPRSPRRSAY